jgi:hypothetical protein
MYCLHGTTTRTILIIIALINQGLVIAGKNPLPFEDDQIAQVISFGFTAVTALAAGERGWPVGMVFEATIDSGKLTESDYGEPVKCFKSVPDGTIPSQANFFKEYLAKRY